MKFAPKEPVSWNDIQPIGQYFDWVHGGTPGTISNRTIWYERDEMPVNYTNRRENGGYSPGGDWLAYSRFTQYSGEEGAIYRSSWAKAFEGWTRVKSGYGDYDQYTPIELAEFKSNLEQRGAEAWNALRPDQPDFSAANALYELRETPRALKQSLSLIRGKIRREALRRGKSSLSWAGEWYLAIQFGWIPLYRDVRNFSKAYDGAHKRLRQLIKDESRPVRRRRNLNLPQPTPTEQVIRYDKPYNPYIDVNLVTQCYKSGRHCKTVKNDSLKVDTWAVAQFRYLLPPGPRHGGWKKEMFKRIMGGRLTPSAVYNMIPWTWLADYFTDLGQFIEAVSPGVTDRLYADYAYIMEKRTRVRRTTAQYAPVISKGGSWTRRHSYRTTTDVVKIRVRASPFQFGLKQEDLTPHQTAILGALGLSRLP